MVLRRVVAKVQTVVAKVLRRVVAMVAVPLVRQGSTKEGNVRSVGESEHPCYYEERKRLNCLLMVNTLILFR